MKVTTYLPYYDYNDGDFDVNNDYYKSNDDYFNAMQRNVEQTRNAVTNGMVNYLNNGSVSEFKSSDGQTYRFGQKTSQTQEKVAYSKCEAIVYGEDGKEKDVDSIISDCVSKDVQLYILKFDLDTSEEDFEQELNLWSIEHKRIEEASKRIKINKDKWQLDNEPQRNIRISFKNKANEEKYAEMVNCKIVEKPNGNTYIIISEEINLIDKIY